MVTKNKPYVTRSGRVLSDADVEAIAEEVSADIDVEALRREVSLGDTLEG
jgi:hypothetical protein